jgi:integrase/recombinase XerD
VTALRQRMIEDMQVRNFSPRTVECYVYHVGAFAKYFGRAPDLLGPEEVRRYQVYLATEKRASWASFNQAVCALRFLYRTTLPRPWPVAQIPFAKKPKQLPVVLGPEEVARLLPCVRPLKQQMVLATIYAAGLRLEEALRLQVADIDSARMLLRVACGKGAKERLVPLSPRLLEELRRYWRAVRPATWLFPGGRANQPLDGATIQKACKWAGQQAGLTKRVTPHVLRHSYATGLLEAGVDLLTIQRLLGHRSFSTTLVYLHVRRPRLESIASPFDWLPLEQCPRFGEPSPAPSNSATSCAPTAPIPPARLGWNVAGTISCRSVTFTWCSPCRTSCRGWPWLIGGSSTTCSSTPPLRRCKRWRPIPSTWAPRSA